MTDFDVVVLGGGSAGVAAAVAAARSGAKTAIVERHGYFGGMATGGLVLTLYGHKQQGRWIKGGIIREIIEGLLSTGAATEGNDSVTVHPEYLKLLYQRMILGAGVKPFMYTLLTDAFLINDFVDSIRLEGKGLTAAKVIEAKVYVDATGDADSAPLLDVPFTSVEKLRPVTLVSRYGNVDTERAIVSDEIQEKAEKELGHRLLFLPTVNPGEVWTDDNTIGETDCSDPESLADAEFEARERAARIFKFYRENVPGFERATWIDTAPQIGVRESRLIEGRYRLKLKDIDQDVSFPDNVVLNKNYLRDPQKDVFGVPLGCLIPKSVNNLLYAGRCISVDSDILDYVREIPSCTCIGEAAGVTAAWLADKPDSDPGELWPAIQSELISRGAVL